MAISRGRFGAWRAAWEAGKNATEPRARALVDRAVGELARLEASLGHFDELAALFEEIGNRPVTGPATEAIQTAREELILAAKDPRHLFLCGPTALMSLMLAQGSPFQQVSFLQWYQASAKGHQSCGSGRAGRPGAFCPSSDLP